MRWIAAVLIVVACALPAVAQEEREYKAWVSSVSDGDTLRVHGFMQKQPTKVRLNGIDCPELKQAFGEKAKKKTESLCLHKNVTIVTHGQDKYGRTIADVFVHGKSVNQRLVKDGCAWWFRRYSPDNREMESLEAQARKKKRGLWKDANPMPPWEFRHPDAGLKSEVISPPTPDYSSLRAAIISSLTLSGST